MKTILVDDMPLDMSLLQIKCKDFQDIEIVGAFDDYSNALSYAADNEVECALLDIDMPGMNGIELADLLQKAYKDIIIVFVTAYSKFALEIMKKEENLIIYKPVLQENLEEVVNLVRNRYSSLKKTA